MVKCGGYILGEFGHLIASQAGCSAPAQLAVLKEKFITATTGADGETRQLLLTAFVKLGNAHPSLRPEVEARRVCVCVCVCVCVRAHTHTL